MKARCLFFYFFYCCLLKVYNFSIKEYIFRFAFYIMSEERFIEKRLTTSYYLNIKTEIISQLLNMELKFRKQNVLND